MSERTGTPAATPSGEIIAETLEAAGRLVEDPSTDQQANRASDTSSQPSSNSVDARDGSSNSGGGEESKDGEEDEETCGFCIFMKAGGCKETFDDWSKCIDTEREKGSDYPSDCRDKTFALRECMLQNKEYYAPVLQDEVDFVADKEEEDRVEAAAAIGG